MRAVKWWLRRVAGEELARDICGDVAESGGGARRLLAITAGITIKRAAEVIARVLPARAPWQGAFGDFRYAARALRKSPGYTATVISVMALSMSLAITVFAVVDGVLFKPLPYSRIGELVSLDPYRSADGPGAGTFGVSASDFFAWKAAVPQAEFAAYSIGGSAYIDSGAEANYNSVTENFFDTLEQRPIIGGFDRSDFISRQPASPAPKQVITPILITYGAWQKRFGGDPGVIGRVIHGEYNAIWQVKGILRADFLFPETSRWVPEFVTPLAFAPGSEVKRYNYLRVIARLPAAVTLNAAQIALARAAVELAAKYPGVPGKHFTFPFDRVTVNPLDQKLRSTSRPAFGLVFAAAALLVLLGCLNVTGLAAARAQDRRRELALRRSLGATRSALVRLLGAESAIVVVAGAALGLLGAVGLLRFVEVVLPPGTVLFRALAIDTRVGVFAFLMCCVSVVLTTLWPAWASTGKSARPILAETSGTTAQRRFARGLIVSTQIALSLIMALGGVLVGSSLWRVWREDTGFGVRNIYTLSLHASEDGDRARVAAIIADLRRVPGVTAVAGTDFWLLARAKRGSRFDEPAGVKSTTDIQSMGVTEGYFETAGLAAMDGRLPTRAELETGAPVLVVSKEVARQFWPGRPAVGQSLVSKGVTFNVVGVVADGRYVSFDLEPEGEIYYPVMNDHRPDLSTVFVRTDHPRDDLLPTLMSLISSRYPMFRVTKAQTMTAALGETIRMRQFRATLFVAFGIAGVTIAGIGVLALVAITTSRRTREVGVRMALGARPLEIAGLIVRQELVAVVCGVSAGGVASFWIVRLLRGYMYKISVYDPALWTAAVGLLLIVAIAGALIPAMRASRVDPVKALRVD